MFQLLLKVVIPTSGEDADHQSHCALEPSAFFGFPFGCGAPLCASSSSSSSSVSQHANPIFTSPNHKQKNHWPNKLVSKWRNDQKSLTLKKDDKATLNTQRTNMRRERSNWQTPDLVHFFTDGRQERNECSSRVIPEFCHHYNRHYVWPKQNTRNWIGIGSKLVGAPERERDRERESSSCRRETLNPITAETLDRFHSSTRLSFIYP
jgi:hypothetical protein